MSSNSSTAIHGGGTVFLLLLILMFLMCMPFGTNEANAQGDMEASSTSLGDFIAASGIGGWLIILLGLAIVPLTLIGVMKSRKEHSWPHWRALIRSMGEAAFLIGIAATILGMIVALNEITRLGANVTPRDMAGGITRSLVAVLFGALVSLQSLVCAGIVRLNERKAFVIPDK